MATPDDRITGHSPDAGGAGATATPAVGADHPPGAAAPGPSSHPEATAPFHPGTIWIKVGVGVVLLAVVAAFGIRWAWRAFQTICTDDAYVNGKVTLVAPRVAGQVKRVLVDNNYRVKERDLLVELDKEPFEVQVAIKEAAVEAAKADLVAAEAQVNADVAQARANRFKLNHAIEDVNNQIANLRANVQFLKNKQATLVLAEANLKRGKELAPSGGISKEELNTREQTVKVDQALVEQALQTVYANRVNLGLPEKPEDGKELGDVPEAKLRESYSEVRYALAALMQSAARFGYTSPAGWQATPKEVIDAFYKQDPKGDFNEIIKELIPKAPAIVQARAKVQQANEDLRQARLNLYYCDIKSDIDGVITQCDVYPGNYVQVGQNLMAVRSLTDIWVDANFKETQLGDLRIGQRVVCDVDMYGSRRQYEGRITGFTMGTGQTLALLPPQNATGNFVKIVQRLPVRIDLTKKSADAPHGYDPDEGTLFTGLSVEPCVYFREKPEGKNAGKFLQEVTPLPKVEPYPKAK
jgi:membrane fusion protein (multidrug efflux system)